MLLNVEVYYFCVVYGGIPIDVVFVFRTVALSEHFSSYNLGNDPAFLAKVTKTMFGHYLATYIV